MFLKDFNLNKRDLHILLIVLVFSIILNVYYMDFNMKLGIYCSDIYVYLLNALYFSGININSTQTIYLSPVICFLTSLLFSAGVKSNLAIVIVSGVFAIIGNIGLYVLFRLRFKEILSFCAVILYSTFALNLTWLSNGSIDIPAVSITILIVLLTAIAVKNNRKYYQILIPLFVIGFFTRYTVVLILPVLVLYYLYHNGFKIEKSDLKYILRGIVFGLITTAVILIPILNMGNGNFGVGGQISQGMIGGKGSQTDLAYNTDTGYYLVNFINFISTTKISFANRTPVLESPSVLSYIILLILGAGGVLFMAEEKFNLKEKIIPIAILLVALLSFNHVSSFITIILVFFALLILGKDSENKNGLVMISWMLVYFIFFSYYDIKVNRYIIPATVPFIYLVMASVERIEGKLKISNVIPVILIILFLVQGFSLCFAFESTDQFIAPQEMSDYIINEIPDYANETIGVYNMRPYHWYLGENITGIESNDTEKIENANITYYISDIAKNDLNGFKEMKSIDNLYLYQKTI